MKSIYAVLMMSAIVFSGVGPLTRAENKASDIVDQQKKDAGAKLEKIGATLADESTARDIRGLLARTVNDGASEKGFDNLVGCLAKADRDRIGDFKHQKLDDLNRAIVQFRLDFKTKYHEDFQIRPEHFRDAFVYAGKDKKSATVSLPELTFDQKVDSASVGPLLDGKIPAKGVIDKKPASVPDLKVTPEVKGPTLTLNLLQEGMAKGMWRIDIPNQIDADQLKDNLTRHLQMLDDQKATWPVDSVAAYHAAAFHILSALNDSALASDR